MTKTTLNKTCS